jgi:hypothetical protein
MVDIMVFFPRRGRVDALAGFDARRRGHSLDALVIRIEIVRKFLESGVVIRDIAITLGQLVIRLMGKRQLASCAFLV